MPILNEGRRKNRENRYGLSSPRICVITAVPIVFSESFLRFHSRKSITLLCFKMSVQSYSFSARYTTAQRKTSRELTAKMQTSLILRISPEMSNLTLRQPP